MNRASWRWRTAAAMALLAALALPGAAAAQALPHFNVRPGCASRGANAADDVKTCLQDEQNARDQLAKDWSGYARPDRSSCIVAARSGGIQSYIELLVCLQIAKDARSGNAAGTGMGAPRRR